LFRIHQIPVMERWSILPFIVALILVGCGPSGPDPHLAELQARVAYLEGELARRSEQLNAAATKLSIAGDLQAMDSPLKSSFKAPEFWEVTVDVGSSECCKRCADDNTASQTACDVIDDPVARSACRDEALAQAANCVDRCASRFPPGGGPGR
jgi:hypothetical protein